MNNCINPILLHPLKAVSFPCYSLNPLNHISGALWYIYLDGDNAMSSEVMAFERSLIHETSALPVSASIFREVRNLKVQHGWECGLFAHVRRTQWPWLCGDCLIVNKYGFARTNIWALFTNRLYHFRKNHLYIMCCCKVDFSGRIFIVIWPLELNKMGGKKSLSTPKT